MYIEWYKNVLPKKGDALLRYDVYHTGLALDALVFKVDVKNHGIVEQEIQFELKDGNNQSKITLDIQQLCQQMGSDNLERMRLRCFAGLHFLSESKRIDIFKGKVCGANCYGATPLLFFGILFGALIVIFVILICICNGLNRMSVDTNAVTTARI